MKKRTIIHTRLTGLNSSLAISQEAKLTSPFDAALSNLGVSQSNEIPKKKRKKVVAGNF